MLRSSASINDGCTIIWDHQVAGKQFDKKLNRKTRSKACSQQSLIFLENQAKICTILLWWWICLQEKSWLYTNICRMNHVMAFQGVVVCVPLISLLSPQLLLFISHEPTLLQQHHIFIPSKRQKCTTANNQWQQHWRWNQPRWYLLKEFSLCQISTGCPASGFFAESMPRENKIMLLISPGSSSFLLPSLCKLAVNF